MAGDIGRPLLGQDSPPEFTTDDLHDMLVAMCDEELSSIRLEMSAFPGVLVDLFDRCDSALEMVRVRHPVRPYIDTMILTNSTSADQTCLRSPLRLH